MKKDKRDEIVYLFILYIIISLCLIGIFLFLPAMEEKTNENVFCDYFNKLSIENIKNNQGYANIYEKNVAIKCISG